MRHVGEALRRVCVRPKSCTLATKVCNSSSSSSSFWGSTSEQSLSEQYLEAKRWLQSKKLPSNVDALSVFANAELDLADIDVYGFDYDYTLASYTDAVEHFIFDEAKAHLVDHLKYPRELLELQYDSSLSVRGLHFDIERGLLLKVDAFHQIQFGCVYRGRQSLSNAEVLKLYGRRRIPQDHLEAHLKLGPESTKFIQLVDIFSKPMACLISLVIQWFVDHGVAFMPESISMDVGAAVGQSHPRFHTAVIKSPSSFLERDPTLLPYLTELKKHGKRVFLITNSPFALVDAGMTHLVGQEWRQIFDLVVVAAKKPSFFTGQREHLRRFDPNTNTLTWDQVDRLKPGEIYARGNISELQALTGWEGESVLYFGDHPYADLADLSLNHGWRTGAILREVEDEISVMNKADYKWGVNWSSVLQTLIEENQDKAFSKQAQNTLEQWENELWDIRLDLKRRCNPYFGSIFRTHKSSTFFSRRLFRFADIYTSRVTNLSRYSLTHAFYPRRGALPHEFPTWFV